MEENIDRMIDRLVDEAVSKYAEKSETVDAPKAGIWVEPDEEKDDLAEAVEQAAEIGFDLDRFRYNGPWPEKIPDPADCVVYNGGASTVKELLTGDTQPVLAIGGKVWDEIQYLVHKTPNTELACFLVLKQFASCVPKYLALDLFFPKQETGGGGVAIDAPSVNRFYEDLNKHEDYREHMHSRLCHLHSHAGMGCFWSAADTNQQMSRDDLGFYDDFRFYCVVNTKNEIRCSFVQYVPFLHRYDNIPVVVIGKPEPLSDERKAELDSWIKDRTSPLTTNVFEDLRSFPAYATEEYQPKVAQPKTAFFGYSYGKADDRGRKYKDRDDDWRLDSFYDYEYDDRSHSYRRNVDDLVEIGRKAIMRKRGRTSGFHRPERRIDKAERRRNVSITEDFLGYCLTKSSPYNRDMFSSEELENMECTLQENGSETASEIINAMSARSWVDRHDIWVGFLSFLDYEPTDVTDIAESLVSWVDWLRGSEADFEALGEFLSRRY